MSGAAFGRVTREEAARIGPQLGLMPSYSRGPDGTRAPGAFSYRLL